MDGTRVYYAELSNGYKGSHMDGTNPGALLYNIVLIVKNTILCTEKIKRVDLVLSILTNPPPSQHTQSKGTQGKFWR